MSSRWHTRTLDRRINDLAQLESRVKTFEKNVASIRQQAAEHLVATFNAN